MNLDPDFGYRDRDCIDGGGRNGRPTLLAEIARLKGDNPTLKLTDQVWETLAASVGHESPDSTKQEAREMERRGTVMSFCKRSYDARGREHVVIDCIGLTTVGREYLERKSA